MPKARLSPPLQAPRELRPSPADFIENFRQAAKGRGRFCPVKNELHSRRGGESYRITCGVYELRFKAPGQQEVAFFLAPDATVDELKRSLIWMLSAENRKAPQA